MCGGKELRKRRRCPGLVLEGEYINGGLAHEVSGSRGTLEAETIREVHEKPQSWEILTKKDRHTKPLPEG